MLLLLQVPQVPQLLLVPQLPQVPLLILMSLMLLVQQCSSWKLLKRLKKLQGLKRLEAPKGKFPTTLTFLTTLTLAPTPLTQFNLSNLWRQNLILASFLLLTMNKFYGTGVAIVTPFAADGQVDFEGLKKLINYLIDGGIDYLVSLGTTGESATLSKDEKKKVFEFTAEIVNKRVPLIAGIGGNNTYEIVESVKNFAIDGYDAILSVSPYYNKPTQEGIYQHYKAIAENASLPIILYNVPGRTGSNITAETTVRLANDFKNIIAIKEASGNFDQFNQIMRDKPADFMLISGDDPVTLPMMALGAVGVISVVGNALPRQFSNMVRLCAKGDYQAAQKAHYQFIEFTRLMFVDGNPGGVKTALKYLGICEDYLRLPLVPVSAKTAEKIIEETKKITR